MLTEFIYMYVLVIRMSESMSTTLNLYIYMNIYEYQLYTQGMLAGATGSVYNQPYTPYTSLESYF